MKSSWGPGLAVLGIGLWLGLGAPGDLGAQTPGGASPLVIRVDGPSAQPWTAPAQEVSGTLVFPIRPVAEYLGGEVGWEPTLRKVVLSGPGGRKASVVLGYPKAVIDGRRWIRLPALLRWRQGQVMVSPETFARLWCEIGEPLQYDAKARALVRQKSEAEPALKKTETAPAAKPGKNSLHCVVVDAGHGGKDPGAIGPTQLKEKTVTLEIAQQLAALLEKDLGCKVILTRDDDRFIPLPERPEVANRAQADLFVSIHANASPDRKAMGSQVFIYNREASSHKAAEVARFENKDANYLEIIKDDLRQSVHETDSITAAGLISQEFDKTISETRRIERAPFYVLAKSHMPSVLVETAFISNPGEERLLRQKAFCAKLALAIGRGLQAFAREKK